MIKKEREENNMCINRTFSELDGKVITNGIYAIRYVMENDAPRFALCDILKSLGYKSAANTNYWAKMFNLNQIVGKDNRLRHYVTKEQAEAIFPRLFLMTNDFRDFWNDVVIPKTDAKYAVLKARNKKLEMLNNELSDVYEALKAKNSDLAEKLETLLKERDEICEILKKAV